MKNFLKLASVIAACALTQALLGYESTFGLAVIAPLTGKFKLKDLREKVKGFRTVWTEARRAKKEQKEIDELLTEYNRVQKFIDDAEVAGTKDDDEIEVKAPEQPNELSLEEVQKAITKGVTDAINEGLPENLKGLATMDGVKALIETEFKRLAGDSTKIKESELGTLAKAAATAQMETFKREKRFELSREDADPASRFGDKSGDRERAYLEIPEAWTKGNLPLHGKQMLNLMLKKPMNDGIDAKTVAKGNALGDRILSQYVAHAKMLEQHRGTPGMKALTSTGSGTGDELVPTDLSSQLQRRLFLASNLAAIMAAREIQMPTDPYGLPLSTTRPTFYLESTENTAATASTPGTGKPTLTTIRLVGEVDYSYELDEDSIIPVLPMLQGLLAEAAADAWEHALINGDDTATHQDTDEELLTKSPAFGFKGFRKLALAIAGLKTDLSSGGIGTNANLLSLRKLLKKYGGDPRNLIWLCSPTSAIALQGIAEAVSIDKFGSRATIITGEIAALQGIPIIQSERVREDVDATGVNGGSGNTKATILCINTTRFLTGRRREFMLEVDKNIQAGTNIVVASLRKAFIPIETPSATVTSVAIGYNFAP